ncbi:MAG: hypothetical protein AB7U46_11240 [Paenirhodobacter sp.]|uniref:hypothetical protein n=1 Tax=Paenirhodobacter sp. TaxID=1965326 RepID=UPI003D126211
MLITVNREWVGPISFEGGGFFVQAWRGNLRLWWGIDDAQPNMMTISRGSDPAETYDLNTCNSLLDGMVLSKGEVKNFPYVPNQVIFLRAADGTRAIANIGQWFS